MSSDSSPLSNFVCLDELTQVIYQSFYKFVVLSSVSDDEWTVHVGLAGKEGRWWRGCWKDGDVLRFFGTKSTDKLLESFAEKLAEVFVQGELCISDWTSDRGAAIKFTLGPTTQKPVQIPLIEMASEEAAAHATSIFVDIALQAQSRKCKLYPSTSDYTSSFLSYTPGPSAAPPTGLAHPYQIEPSPKRKESSEQSDRVYAPALDADFNLGKVESPQAVARHTISPARGTTQKKASEEIAKVSHVKEFKKAGPTLSETTAASLKPIAPVRTHKGASLANPNKKARKYEAIEFESDEE